MMREAPERAWFLVCRALGRLLRSARYSQVRVVDLHGAPQVRKRRRFFAPVLIAMSNPLVRLLDIGVRVLPQSEWHEREQLIYSRLYGLAVGVDDDGTLVLPHLPGETLAAVLENPARSEVEKETAIERAVVALAECHRLGFTHGDAMAENVLIDPDAARWFDFETLHDESRPIVWRQADDVRALLMTCLVRTAPGKIAETLECILNVYADKEVTRVLATSFNSVWRRPLLFHLAQGPVSFRCFREVGRRLS